MARMRFGSHPPPRSLNDVVSTGGDRQPEHLGDIPPIPPEPPAVKWSLATWPKTEPINDEENPSDA